MKLEEEIKNFDYEEVKKEINNCNFVNEYGNKKYRSLDAILLNRYDIVKLLFRDNYFFPSNSCKVAIEVGNLDILKLLFLYISNVDKENLIDIAAKHGRLNMIIFLHHNDIIISCINSISRSILCTSNAIDLASENGHFDVVKWLHDFRTEGCTSKAIYNAAEKGHLEILKFLYLNRAEGKLEKILSFASSNGHIHIIEWLHDNSFVKDWSTIDLYDAIISCCFFGKLEVVKWFYKNYKNFFTPEAIDFATEGNHYDVVEFLYNNKLPYTHSAIEFASDNGNLQILSLIYDPSKCVTMRAMNYAAEKGHIDIIIFLHSKGKKCNENTLFSACERGKINVVIWIYFNYGSNFSEYYKIASDKAKDRGHTDIVNFLDKILTS